GADPVRVPADGRQHPDPGAHRGRRRRPREPQGLARRQPHHRPGRNVREGVAPRRVHADHLRGDGRRPPVPSSGSLRPALAMTVRTRATLRVLAFAALIVLLAVFPLFAGAYPVKLLQEILIWGIFAMSLDLLMGYAGMVSFGHSAFFGVGGYIAALLLKSAPGALAALALPALGAGLC